jgi:hypothetical protein
MTNKETKLDLMLSELENFISEKRGIPLSSTDNNSPKEQDHEYLMLLKILSSQRRLLKEGKLIIPLGLSRFAGEWDFEEEIVDLVYSVEKYAKSIF